MYMHLKESEIRHIILRYILKQPPNMYYATISSFFDDLDLMQDVLSDEWAEFGTSTPLPCQAPESQIFKDIFDTVIDQFLLNRAEELCDVEYL